MEGRHSSSPSISYPAPVTSEKIPRLTQHLHPQHRAPRRSPQIMCAQVSLELGCRGGGMGDLFSHPLDHLPLRLLSADAPAASLRVAASSASHLLKRPSLSTRDLLLAVMKRPISCFYL